MTLLFYLRSPAGNTDTARGDGDTGRHWRYEELKQQREQERKDERRKKKEELRAKRLAAKELAEAVVEAEKAHKAKKKRDTELLMILFMHEFDNEH
jgi:hypothetical protein